MTSSSRAARSPVPALDAQTGGKQSHERRRFWPALEALLMIATARSASASLSNPKMAEAGTVVAGDDEGGDARGLQPRALGGGGALLPRDRGQLHRGPGLVAREAIAHRDLEAGPRAREGLQDAGEGARTVVQLAPPEGDLFHGDGHRRSLKVQ